MINLRKIFAVLGVAISCWGLLCPEYSLMNETITVVNEKSGEEIPFETKEHFYDFLNADTGKIIIKSKIWEIFS